MSSNRTKAWIQFAILAVMVIIYLGIRYYQSNNVKNETKTSQTQTSSSKQNTSTKNTETRVPAKVLEVYNYIRQNRDAPQGYVGGRVFANREKRLPLSDGTNKKIKYQEWDVNPKIKGVNRGAERLITGSDSSAYYTQDHYKTFIKFN